MGICISDLSTSVQKPMKAPEPRSVVAVEQVRERNKIFPRTSSEMDLFIKEYDFNKLMLPSAKEPVIQISLASAERSKSFTKSEESIESLHCKKSVNSLNDQMFDQVKQYLDLEFTNNLDKIPSRAPSVANSYVNIGGKGSRTTIVSELANSVKLSDYCEEEGDDESKVSYASLPSVASSSLFESTATIVNEDLLREGDKKLIFLLF